MKENLPELQEDTRSRIPDRTSVSMVGNNAAADAASLTLSSIVTVSASREEAAVEAFSAWAIRSALLPGSYPGILFLTDKDGLVNARWEHGSHSELERLTLTGTDWKGLGHNAVSQCLTTRRGAVCTAKEHTDGELAGIVTLAVPVKLFDGMETWSLGFAGLDEAAAGQLLWLQCCGEAIETAAALSCERCKNQILSAEKEQSQRESDLREELFRTAQKMHTKIDVESVLSELIAICEKVFPEAKADLYLSQDNGSNQPKVQPLVFNAEMDIRTRAFMEGQLIRETVETPLGAYCTVAAPLIGKQGVYGVLQLTCHEDGVTSSHLHFISLLASTAGNAFENAKLYEQSNLLISELRLINEITKRLNQSLKLNDIFEFATNELIEIFGAEFCCILQLDKQTDKLVVQASNLHTMNNALFSKDYGYSGIVFATKEPVIVSDYMYHSDRMTSQLMEITSSRSLIGAPIIVNDEVIGTILVTHRLANFFSYENYKLLQVLSGHIGLAMTNASLHAEVRRRVITDNLTGLYARHYLDEQVNLQQKQDFCGSLILVDIDFFKRVNDTFGHQVGDEILIQVAAIIKTSIRDTDIAARWGGEELAVYLPQVTIEQTIRIAERIRSRVARETKPRVTVSCGISEWSWEDDKISVEALFYKADMALYEAKHQGKNQIRIRN
ncbi:sensor domain-containing diguanylate cyclase [Paenibacillus gansuensis]|uniref:Sensor domain-containing diguanylate cyclase n=1 Tax=Paenibacillus gansuensis TaxID=306542 RepID=A0ABW5PEI4_9BACL